jgi:hypothetical protein
LVLTFELLSKGKVSKVQQRSVILLCGQSTKTSENYGRMTFEFGENCTKLTENYDCMERYRELLSIADNASSGKPWTVTRTKGLINQQIRQNLSIINNENASDMTD